MVSWAHASLLPLAPSRSVQPFCRAYTYVQTPYHGTRNSSSYHQLRRIRQVRRLVGQDAAQQLVSAFILSPLDYCNSLLSRLPRSTIQPQQRVMNAAARVIMNLSLRDHVKSALMQLHWLPVEQKNHIPAVCPHWTSTTIPVDRVSTVSALSGRYRLRSTGSADYVLPRTITRFGERGFFCCGSTLLFLPTSTTLPTPVNSENDSRVYFLIVLTTDYCWRSWTCRIAAPYKFHVDCLIDAWQYTAPHLYDACDAV